MRALYVLLVCAAAQAVVTHAMSSEQSVPPADATPALACVHKALGGSTAVAAVSTLYIRGETKPLQEVGLRPIPGTREISVVFPDQYRRLDVGRSFTPGAAPLNSVVGFDRELVITNPRPPDPKLAALAAHRDFARQMLMRLPRKSVGLSFSHRVTTGAGSAQVAIDAVGTDGFQTTLLVDRESCVPTAIEYATVTPSMSGVARVELSAYRSFGGVRFPTMLKTSIAGQPYSEERVESIEVNTPTAAKAFPSRR